jgi:hypothetical protein
MGVLFILITLLLAPPGLAQTTCFTDHLGTTICSSPDTVIHGSTSSIGTSVYRDTSGNRLEYDIDPTGKSTLELPTGESINWSQSVPGQQGSRDLNRLRKPPPTVPTPAITGSNPHSTPRELPSGQRR